MLKYVQGWSLKPVEVGQNLNPALKVEIPPLSRIISPGLGLFTKI